MFVNSFEQKISKSYLKNGYLIANINNAILFKKLDNLLKKTISKYLNKKQNTINDDFLNFFHKKISKKNLNTIRMNIIEKLLSNKEFKEIYYNISKDYLDLIVGNELAMQKKINLSIQLPNDKDSLLSIHTDTLSGDSSFEVVVWVPFVDCYESKSMYILPPKESIKLLKKMSSKSINYSHEQIYNHVKNKIKFINIKKGQLLIFNQNLFHGNIINKKNETRWSMNCRFKSIFSPYKHKPLGDFFEPITLKPASVDGMKYNF